MKFNRRAISVLTILGVGYSILSAVAKVGDGVEVFLALASNMLMFAAIVLLAFEVIRMRVISQATAKLFGVSLIAVTIAEAVYPALIYSDQTTPSSYWMIFFIQLAINVYIARIICHDRERN
ncbi:hypothetical protein [Vibrio parahaemolyticus]|uniref:hypothetical protein n=1 Tax=Vibrio parahaemolyticus TaxID=670 RepID=UPI00387AA40F